MIGSQNMFPPVIKNLLIINALMFVATEYVFPDMGIFLKPILALYHWESPLFEPWQFITHIFMHGSESHLFFNMFGLWIFGAAIENYWGSKRFLNYYLLTGFGASILHYLMIHFQLIQVVDLVPQEILHSIQDGDGTIPAPSQRSAVTNQYIRTLITPVLGASGALYGVLMAYGMSFPERSIYMYFLFPIKAKYLVMAYGCYSLYRGIQSAPVDSIAHFAHLGGLIFGFIAIWYWRKNNSDFY